MTLLQRLLTLLLMLQPLTVRLIVRLRSEVLRWQLMLVLWTLMLVLRPLAVELLVWRLWRSVVIAVAVTMRWLLVVVLARRV